MLTLLISPVHRQSVPKIFSIIITMYLVTIPPNNMTNIDWGFDFEPVDDLKVTDLSPGNQIICAKAILVQKGCGPITYRIQNRKNSYTWFTTA